MPRLLSATEVEPSALCAAFNAAFGDYLIGPPQIAPGEWPAFLARQGVELAASRVVADGAQVRAFALVGRSGARRRLATMGARPEARGTGAAPELLDRVLAEARAHGESGFELEVFARNERAAALYRSRGFASVGELCAYVRTPRPTAAEGEEGPPTRVNLADAAAWLDAQALGDLPYQVGGAAMAVLAARGQAMEAWRAGRAQLVFSVRDAANVNVASLVDTGAAQGDARGLLRALARQYPAATLRMPQLQRREYGGLALEAEGWERQPLVQWLMRLDFAAGPAHS